MSHGRHHITGSGRRSVTLRRRPLRRGVCADNGLCQRRARGQHAPRPVIYRKGGLGDDDLQWGAQDGVPCIFSFFGDLWQWRLTVKYLPGLCGVSGGLRSVTWLRHPASV